MILSTLCKRAFLCCVLVCFGSPVLSSTEKIDQGRLIVERECQNCHGEQGISDDSTIPSIGGFSTTAIVDLLESYRQEFRPAQKVELEDGTERDMFDVVNEISEEDLNLAALYYDSLTWQPIEQTFDRKLAVQGKRIHSAKCGKCHLKLGTIAAADHAILSGQWREYLVRQFEDFDSRKRRMASKMQQKFDTLSDEDKLALIELYVSGGRISG